MPYPLGYEQVCGVSRASLTIQRGLAYPSSRNQPTMSTAQELAKIRDQNSRARMGVREPILQSLKSSRCSSTIFGVVLKAFVAEFAAET
jgi:hypothetical protein